MENENISAKYIQLIQSVGMGRKSCLYTMLEYCVLARLSAHTDWISCMYLAQYPRLPFCVLIHLYLRDIPTNK